MMKINKLNYEAYAIDYLEGELSGETLKEMERFLEKHPDIKQELDAMVFIPLEADTDIIFKHKNDLIKTPLVPVVESPKPSPEKEYRIRPLFWIGLVAAVLLGGLLVLKFLDTNPGEEYTPIVKEAETVPSLEKTPIELPQETELPLEEARIANDSPATHLPVEPIQKTPTEEAPTTPPETKKVESTPLFAVEKMKDKSKDPLVQSNPKIQPPVLEKAPSIQATPVVPEEPSLETAIAQEAPITIPPALKTPELETPEETVAQAEVEEAPVWQIEPADAIAMNLEEDDLNEPSFETTTEDSDRKKKKLFPKLRQKLSKEKLGKSLLPEAFVSAKE